MLRFVIKWSSVIATVLFFTLIIYVMKCIFFQRPLESNFKIDRNGTMKCLLIWHSYDFSPFNQLGEGSQKFIEKKCPVNDCYVTRNRKLFDEVSEFDVIAFNGRTMNDLSKSNLPQQRSTKQKYLYMNLESNIYRPVGPEWFDNFFNWTSTYRLNSDIPFTYLQVKNKKGEVVGPNADAKWFKKMNDTPEYVVRTLRKKTKAVAWFVSNCKTQSRRYKKYVELQNALSSYGLEIDVYGECGQHSCGRDQGTVCDRMLEIHYHFYLAFENSFTQDYVTEKLLRALHYNVVPIVYGGADYTRFVPPNSYIDARITSPNEIASMIHRSLHSMKLYKQYFRWKSHYDYFNPLHVDVTSIVCDICAALHNTPLMETTTVYTDMRGWWNTD